MMMIWSWTTNNFTENSVHIAMYTPETLLTKYLRTTKQNSELQENKHLQFSVKQKMCFFFHLNKCIHNCVRPKMKIFVFF